MDYVYAEDNTAQFCFPSNNLSCPKEIRSKLEYVVLYIFLIMISFITIFLNLLVIIAISYYKQLHTPTNLLILSLALADFGVGFIVMPIESVRVIDNCWYFGPTFCSLFMCFTFLLTSSSLCSLLFISIDRYIAINDPLRYSNGVTTQRTMFFICLGWFCSATYTFCVLHDHLTNPVANQYCYGHCTLVMGYAESAFDLVITFIVPCFLIMSLYTRVFVVARRQVLLIAVANAHMREQTKPTIAKKSAHKATKTLGLVVMVYLICWIPFYLCFLITNGINTSSTAFNVVSWCACGNSCLNPIIYALFYPWFRTSVKHLLTTTKIPKSFSLKKCAKQKLNKNIM